MARIHSIAAVLLAATTLPLPAALAQGCNFGDDGFAAVACCSAAQPNLPQFPAFQISGSYACFKDCNVEATFPVRVSTVHVPAVCDYAIVALTVTPGSSTAPGFSGGLLAKYSRTWMEPDPTGRPGRQVWRFLINGDLTPTSGAAPCPIPPHPAGSTVHLHGHIDYACEVTPTGVVFRMAMSLHHLQGCVEHGFFSMAPLFGPPAHDDRSYHLVAPGNFNFGLVSPPSGPVPAEAVRSTLFAPAYTCVGEARMPQGQIRFLSRDCVCVAATGSIPYFHYDLVGTANCAGVSSGFASVPMALPLPPLPAGTTALPIGAWTLPPGTFPENRELATHWGLLRYQDPCNTADIPYHFVQGVSTSGHAGSVFTNPTVVYRHFIDLQNMLNPTALWGAGFAPAWGGLFVSKIVWNLNVP